MRALNMTNKKKWGQTAWNSRLEKAQGRDPHPDKNMGTLQKLRRFFSNNLFVFIFFALILYLAFFKTNDSFIRNQTKSAFEAEQAYLNTPNFNKVLSGKVVSIADGDTLTLLDAQNRQIKIRLAEIDTPEKGQPYGKRAKEELSRLVFHKDIRVIQVDIDRYSRIVGKVYVDDLYINKELVSLGAAWVYRDYSDDPVLIALEKEAKEHLRGLWSLPEKDIVPPWEWRRR